MRQLESSSAAYSDLPLPLWERYRPPSAAVLRENAEAKLRLRRIRDAIRVRGYALSIDRNPSPQPSPTRGEGAHCRCGDIDVYFSWIASRSLFARDNDVAASAPITQTAPDDRAKSRAR